MGQDNFELNRTRRKEADDQRLKLWADFLRISPSYNTAAQLPQTSNDSKQVRRTQADFGDVWKQTTEKWWQEHSFRLFGVELSTNNLLVLKVLQQHQRLSRTDMDDVIDTYLTNTHPNMGNPYSVIVSVPIDMDRPKLMRMFSEMLTYFRAEREQHNPVLTPAPEYQAHGELVRLKHLEKCIRVVHFKALNPRMPQWKIGMELNLSPAAAQEMRSGEVTGKLAVNPKAILQVATTKLLSQALTISENAARGIFPSNRKSATHLNSFDFADLGNKLANAHDNNV